jgi:hypothetical protein
MTACVAVPKFRANCAEKMQFLLKYVSITLHWAPFVRYSTDNMLKVKSVHSYNQTDCKRNIRINSPSKSAPAFQHNLFLLESIGYWPQPSEGLIRAPAPRECTTKVKVVLLSNKPYIIIFSDRPNIECWGRNSKSWYQAFRSVFRNALYYKQLKRTGSLLLRRSIHLFLNRSRDINVRLSDKLDISSVCGASGYYSNTQHS